MKKNIKSDDTETRFIAKSWLIIRCLPFLPPHVAKELIEFMLHTCQQLPLTLHQSNFETILLGIKDDHANETKLDGINWWHLIRTSENFCDTTTVIVNINHKNLNYIISFLKYLKYLKYLISFLNALKPNWKTQICL